MGPASEGHQALPESQSTSKFEFAANAQFTWKYFKIKCSMADVFAMMHRPLAPSPSDEPEIFTLLGNAAPLTESLCCLLRWTMGERTLD